MSVLRRVKLRTPDGTESIEYPLGVEAKNVEVANQENLSQRLVRIDEDLEKNEEDIAAVSELAGTNKQNIGANEIRIDALERRSASVDKKIYYFNTIAEMKSANLKENDVCQTLGYYEVNDGEGALYKIINDTSLEDDENNLIGLDNGLLAECILDKNGSKINELNQDITILETVQSSQNNRISEIESLISTGNTGIVIKQEQGQKVTLDNSVNLSFLDFKLYGNKSSEISGNIEIVIENKNRLELRDETKQHNNVTAVSKDGIVTLNGEASGGSFNTLSNTYDLEAGEYVISANNSEVNEKVSIRITDSDYHTLVILYLNKVNNTASFTLSKDYENARFQVKVEAGISVSNFIIKPQLEKGKIASDLEVHKSMSRSLSLGTIKLQNEKDCIYKSGSEYFIHNEGTLTDTKITDSTLVSQLDSLNNTKFYNGLNYLYTSNTTKPTLAIKYLIATWINSTEYSKENVLYFSESLGDDRNDGLTERTPKQDPTPYLELGNYTCFLRSGDTFFLNQISIGSNTKVATYGGKIKAKISGSRLSNDTFEQSETTNIYKISLNVSELGVIKLEDEEKWNWKRKVTNNLTKDREYYLDVSTGILYLYSTEDISGKTIYYTVPMHSLYIKNATNVLVDNIEIEGYGKHGMQVNADTSEIAIANCDIHDIGGSIQAGYNVKFGNGIEVWLINVNNVYIYNNYVHDCYDAGITPQINGDITSDSNNIQIHNNHIKNCAYVFEYFNNVSEISCKNIKFFSNFLENCKDITEGYRENSSTTSIALMNLWRSLGANDSIYIEDNICIGSEKYAISFAQDNKDKFHFKNNKFIVSSNEPIRNPSYYSGDTEDILQLPDEPTTADEFAKLTYYRSLGMEKVKLEV